MLSSMRSRMFAVSRFSGGLTLWCAPTLLPPGARPHAQSIVPVAKTNAPEFAQYSDGRVLLLKAVPARRGLIVSWELIGFIDVITIEALRASIDAALDALTTKEEVVRRRHVRRSLSVIAGGV